MHGPRMLRMRPVWTAATIHSLSRLPFLTIAVCVIMQEMQRTWLLFQQTSPFQSQVLLAGMWALLLLFTAAFSQLYGVRAVPLILSQEQCSKKQSCQVAAMSKLSHATFSSQASQQAA